MGAGPQGLGRGAGRAAAPVSWLGWCQGWPKQKQTDGTVKPNTSDNTSAVHMSYTRGLLIFSYAKQTTIG
ncbi:hypothetical protein Q8A67_023379 [Cirrhinus molitorella]|uniref:Uncharacterized protein n=1 Tax=Cirrhinus molitorella TaxID=172907 RepID=A0AA88PDT8_9TELE|nr:hypothetical protein Q8A67_023379 [Cirrhinus molitorella]